MPARLRNTLLYAAGLQVFGPDHNFTKSIEDILTARSSSDDGEADPMDDLSDAERSELLERYDQIMLSLPVERIAA